METKDIESYLVKARGALRLFECFFASRADARVLKVVAQDKLAELGFGLERDWFDIDAVNVIQVVRKCAMLVPVRIFRPFEYAAYAKAAKFDFYSERWAHKNWGLSEYQIDHKNWWGDDGGYAVWGGEEVYARLIDRLIDSPEGI